MLVIKSTLGFGIITEIKINVSIHEINKINTDTFSYKKIEVKSNIFSIALNALRDSMCQNFQSDQFDYVRVLFNDSNKVIGLVPKYITNLICDYTLNEMTKKSMFNNNVIEPIYLLFEVNDVLFQINRVDLEKLDFDYILINGTFLFDIKKWKSPKSKRCKNRKGYLKHNPFLTFNLNNNQINKINFKTKENTILGITRQDL